MYTVLLQPLSKWLAHLRLMVYAVHRLGCVRFAKQFVDGRKTFTPDLDYSDGAIERKRD